MSANICSEGPFTDPDIIFDLLGFIHQTAIIVTVGSNVTVLTIPGKVLMRIHHDVLVIIVSEKVIPKIWVKVEGFMEHKLQAWLLLLDKCPDSSIKAE